MRPVAQNNALANVIRGLAAEKNPACLVDAQGTFLFVNDAWERYAVENGDDPNYVGSAIIGTAWLDHLRGDDVRKTHAELLQRALRARGPHPRPVVQVGEANTATTSALLSTRFDPVLQSGEPMAIRIVHTIVRERPIGEVYEIVHRPAEDYRGPDGKIVQCPCCRRLRDPAEAEHWDFVPELLPNTNEYSHQLCELCAELHYPREEPT